MEEIQFSPENTSVLYSILSVFIWELIRTLKKHLGPYIEKHIELLFIKLDTKVQKIKQLKDYENEIHHKRINNFIRDDENFGTNSNSSWNVDTTST